MSKLLACLGVAAALALSSAAGGATARVDILTPPERQWLTRHGPLRYAPDPAFPPFEFFRKNGDVAGITPEILDLMAQNLGTSVQPVRYANWAAVLDGIKRNECDVLGTLAHTPERDDFLDFTDPYLSIPSALYVNAASSWKTGFAELTGHRVGVVLNSDAHNWLEHHHPEVAFVTVNNIREGLEALSLNRIEAFLESLPVADYVIAENGYTNVRALPEIVYTSPQYLATHKGQPILLSILDKGLASVPVEERLRIFARWTGDDPARHVHHISPWVWRIGIFLLLAVAGFAAWNTSLRRRVARRTRDLQESERHFRRLLEDLPVAAAAADADGRIEFLNRKFVAQFGYAQEDLPTLQQWSVLAFPDPTYRAEVMLRWATEAETAKQMDVAAPPIEVQATSRDGKVRTVNVVSRTIGNKLFTVFDDLTERAKMEQQLRQAQKMEAVGQLAGGVAHDFNNLLTVIQGNSDLLLDDPAITGNARQSVHQIAEVAQRASNLTRQLLTFSRRQAVQRRALSLNDVIASAYKMLSRILGEHITVEVNYGTDLPPIHADAGMLEQVIVNLAVNSRDAMPRGGRLTISTSIEEVAESELSRHGDRARAGQFVVLSVRDTGTGINPEDIVHLFEPFYTTKDVGKGTGLGLATVYGIVQQHEGWVEVASEVDHGTTMQVYLPTAAEDAAAGSPDTKPLPPQRGSEAIFLVEDEAMVRDLVKRSLVHAGYQVVEAVNAVEALTLWPLYRDKVDLLFTDMVMPGGIDGRELASRLIKDKPDLRVIYSSGYSQSLLDDDSDWLNHVHFLGKPFNLSELLATVRACLDETKDPPLDGPAAAPAR